MAEEIKGEGFTVIDRRRHPEVRTRRFMPEDRSEESTAKTSEKEKTSPEPDIVVDSTQREETLPQTDFSSFIFSLSTSALIHFGAIPDPITKKIEKNLTLAKQTIDLLGLLKDKTRGNLTKEEEELLENILYDLRIRYVKESKVR